MALCEAHKNKLLLHYAINPERPEVKALEESSQLRTVTSQEIEDLSGWRVDGPGLYIGYPGNGAFVIRPDNPPANGPKYLHPKGEPNHLFVPPGFDLAQSQKIWITEGELKSLSGFLQGLPIVALGGVWSWRTSGPEAELLADGEKLKDEEALLPELAIDWSGKKVALLYDSDIVPGHRAYDAFPRLAEQLYRLGAEEVRVLSFPSVAQGQKTGLDDYILARGPEQALQDLQAMKNKKEPYLPWRDGGMAYAERLIKSENLEDKQKAVVAYLGAKGEPSTLDWLKHQTGLQSDVRKALLSEAKKKLKELQAKPRDSSSSQGGEDLPELGPEYAEVKRLLQAQKGEYSLDKQGRLCKEVQKLFGETFVLLQIPVCNFAPWPIREILKDSGNGTPERYLELEGLLQGGAPLRPVKISLSDFLEKPSSWAGLAWGAKAALRPHGEKEAGYAIQEMARDIPETVIYTHLGWKKIDGEWIYLHGKGAIGTDKVETEITEDLGRYMLPGEIGDIKEAIKASLFLLELAPRKIMIPLLGDVFLAPLCEPLKQAGVEPSHILFLLGSSGVYKSSLAALILSHYGDFNKNTLPASFEDTKGGFEILASLAKDCILVIDDFHPAKNLRDKATMEGNLEYLSRNQGDRHGKTRMTSSSNSLREGHPPRGLVVVTGEICPLSGSSLVRNMIIKLLADDINKEKYAQALAQKHLLPQAMAAYLNWLRPQLDDIAKQDATTFRDLRDKAAKDAKTPGRHGRLNETVAHLYMGLASFIQFAISQEALSLEEAQKLLLEAWQTLNQIADEQTFEAEAGEPVKRFFEILRILEATGRVHFADMEDNPSLLDHRIKVGWRNEGDGITFLLYEEAWLQVSKYLLGLEESLPCSKNGFPELVEIKGLLAKRGKKKRVYQERIGEGRPYVLAVWDKAFEQEGENE